jgi:hypothetical protein
MAESRKMAYLTQNKAIKIIQKFDHFLEKLYFFAENCDHNMDPRVCTLPVAQ